MPAGERWPGGTLRPAVEDAIGAGAIAAALPSAQLSPEADAAAAQFRAAGDLEQVLAATASGRELVADGLAADVLLAAALDTSTAAPRLRGRPADRIGAPHQQRSVRTSARTHVRSTRYLCGRPPGRGRGGDGRTCERCGCPAPGSGRGGARLAGRIGVVAGRWVEVGDGVLARRYAELDLTVGLVVGRECALVIDTRGDHRQGAELAAAVRTVTALPLVVAITHAHFDHCFGTAALRPTAVHAHPRCTAAIRATAAAQRAQWSTHYRDRGDPTTAAALAATEPALPDHEAPATLDLGGRTVELLHLGAGHTDHDVLVHVDDVVFAGDLVEQGAPPDLGDAVLAAWPATLDALLALRPRTVVPGHGDPVDPAFVSRQRGELAEVAALHTAVAAGTLDPATAARRSPYPDVPWSWPSSTRRTDDPPHLTRRATHDTP